jgi:hypothetical protein
LSNDLINCCSITDQRDEETVRRLERQWRHQERSEIHRRRSHKRSNPAQFNVIRTYGLEAFKNLPENSLVSDERKKNDFKSTILRDVKPRYFVVYRRFGGLYFLHVQGHSASKNRASIRALHNTYHRETNVPTL